MAKTTFQIWNHPQTGEVRIYVNGLAVPGLNKVYLSRSGDQFDVMPIWRDRASEIDYMYVLDIAINESLAEIGLDESSAWNALLAKATGGIR